jgi:hypothetical protein
MRLSTSLLSRLRAVLELVQSGVVRPTDDAQTRRIVFGRWLEALWGMRHDPQPAAPQPPPAQWRPPWERRDEDDQVPDRPETFIDGEPIHYPTPEELQTIGRRESASGDMSSFGYWLLFGVLAVLGILTLLEVLSGRPPPVKDPYWEELRRNMGKRF